MGHRHRFLTIQGHGGPPRMSDQPKAGATSETAQTWKTIHTKHTLSHPDKANMEWWLRRPNDIRGPRGGLKFPDICLTGEEKPRKILTQETCPDRGSNPGPLYDSRACYHWLHSGGRDPIIINYRPKCNLKCNPIINFEIKMVDIRDVIVSKAVVHGLCYANCDPFLVIVK